MTTNTCDTCDKEMIHCTRSWKQEDGSLYCGECYLTKDDEEECGICERCGGESEDKDFRYCEYCDQQMLDDEYAAQQEESDDE